MSKICKDYREQVIQILEGVSFPANKRELIAHAKKNDAPETIIHELEKLSDQHYTSMESVCRL